MGKIKIKSPKEIELIRDAGALAAETLIRAGELCKPGVSTLEIDNFVGEYTKKTWRYFCLSWLPWLPKKLLHQLKRSRLPRDSWC